jgi:hypothetical protein
MGLTTAGASQRVDFLDAKPIANVVHLVGKRSRSKRKRRETGVSSYSDPQDPTGSSARQRDSGQYLGGITDAGAWAKRAVLTAIAPLASLIWM